MAVYRLEGSVVKWNGNKHFGRRSGSQWNVQTLYHLRGEVRYYVEYRSLQRA
jgi:hypothetical protein